MAACVTTASRSVCVRSSATGGQARRNNECKQAKCAGAGGGASCGAGRQPSAPGTVPGQPQQARPTSRAGHVANAFHCAPNTAL
uniref:Uncharacterized protein n=1 Tax=viral metagenome TaxID=1070528 RepID=A0A6C0AU20_9ZZZZ